MVQGLLVDACLVYVGSVQRAHVADDIGVGDVADLRMSARDRYVVQTDFAFGISTNRRERAKRETLADQRTRPDYENPLSYMNSTERNFHVVKVSRRIL